MPTMPRVLERPDSTATGRWLAVLGCMLAWGTSCDRADHEAAPPPPGAGTTTAAASAPVAAPSLGPSSRAAPSATATAVATGDWSGSWVGSYDAKKGAVLLPAKVKDKALAADDGKSAVGQGSIEITVLPSGDVRGTISGALGKGAITGKVDGSTLRTVVNPDDLQAANAMTGIFIGDGKGQVIRCELRVASPDATVIREATVELTRKK